MADLCTRLRVLLVTPWLVALVSGGIPAENCTMRSQASRCILEQQQQHSRYVVVKKNTPVYFICHSPASDSVQWYKRAENSTGFHSLDHTTSRYSVERKRDFINFTIFSTTPEDNGVYVCHRRNLTAEKRQDVCGTELRVTGHRNTQQFQKRSTLKDIIIIIQSILLVIFISVPILLFLDKGEVKESPEEDHTYEGLQVEQMATYEDITPFRDMKAKWTVGEHPGEE